MKKTKIILTACAVLLIIAGAGALLAYRYISEPYSGEAVRVNIPANTNPDGIKSILMSSLGDSFGSKVAMLRDRQDKAPERSHGSYLIEPGTSALRIARTIANGQQTPVRLTFNNIRTMQELAARISSVLEADSASFLAACDTILTAHGFETAQFPAAFLPDTYEFYWTTSSDKIVGKLLDERDRFWNDSRREKASRLGLNPVKVATIASIAEEETAKPDERGKVARLYLNRLKLDMPLQADPTVKFALGDFSLRRITGKHLSVSSPYNTYKNSGLPPGPIRIVEKATLDAVLDAPEHDYLYMCAKSDFSGYHDFARDYNRHRINSARYHHALDKRGIK